MRTLLLLALLLVPFSASAENASSPLAALGGKKDGADFIDISADQSLEWHEGESMYIARGNAVARRGDVKVEADLLKAHNRKKADGTSEVWKLEAEGHVRISNPNHTASGDRGVYDIDSKKAVLTGNDLRFVSPTDTVTAKQSFEYSETEGRIDARGGATATREGRRVEADGLTAWLALNKKTGNQDIERLEASGHVKITSPQDAVACDKAVYHLVKNTATLSGNVKITRGANQLKGDKVEADFKTGQSRLLNTGKGRVSALIVGSGNKPVPGKKNEGRKPADQSPVPNLFEPATP